MPFDASPHFPSQSPATNGAIADPVLRVLTLARAALAGGPTGSPTGDPTGGPTGGPAGGWCRGALARDAAGRPVAFASPAARAFCLAGAVYRAGLVEPRGTMGALLLLMQCAEPLTVADCNDRLLDSRHEAVAFLDRVLESRRAELGPRATPPLARAA